MEVVMANRCAEQPSGRQTKGGRTRQTKGGGTRLWCHLFLNMNEVMDHDNFHLASKVTSQLDHISEQAGITIKLRGKGSGNKEGERNKEAIIPLLVSIISDENVAEKFEPAVNLVIQQLQKVEELFRQYCDEERKLGKDIVRTSVWEIREMSKDAATALSGEVCLESTQSL